jgi:hypothetical protein
MVGAGQADVRVAERFEAPAIMAWRSSAGFLNLAQPEITDDGVVRHRSIRAVHRAGDERAWWRQAGIDPIKVARRLWKATHGMGQRRSQRPALPRPHDAAASSDPKNEDISAAATPQEEARLPDLPG